MHDMNNDIAKVLISEEQLQAKVAELGAQISRDYEGKDLLLVSILITTMSGCGTASFNSGSPFVIFEKSHTTSIPELEVYASKIDSTSSPSVI